MKPADLGLPPKFAAFRPGQDDIVVSTYLSEKRFTLLSIPTGGGKSIIYTAIARLLNVRALILTANKALQVQLTNDFGCIGLKDIRGQNNYRCKAVDVGQGMFGLAAPGTTCDEGPCHVGMDCALKSAGCTYYDDVRLAEKAPSVVTNYSYWMTQGRYTDPNSIGQFGLLILDEAHAAPDLLAEFCAITLEEDEVRQLIGLKLPPIDEGTEVWVEWAQVAYEKCRQTYKAVRDELAVATTGETRRPVIKKLRRLVTLGRQLKELARARSWRRAEPSNPPVWLPGAETDWVTERTTGGIRFSPVWAHGYAEDYLFRRIPRVILTSATLQPVVGNYLGIDPKESEYKEYASRFDPKRRPFIHVRTGVSLNKDSNIGEWRVLVNKLDRILEKRTHLKGIIHTRSYERAHRIKEMSKFSHLMMTHSSATTKHTVDTFKNSKIPRILVSPAVEEGFDFPYDQCRFQVIIKVPFIDARSPIMMARKRSDKRYLNYLTALAIIQMVGRGMRAEDDWCETFLLDDQIDWFWPAAKKMKLWPNWFASAFTKVISPPDPIRFVA